MNWSEPRSGGGSAHDFNAEPVLIANFERTDTVDVEDRFNGGMRAQQVHRFLRDGELVDVWGAADLSPKLAGIPQGTLTRIEFTGLEEYGEQGRKIKRFVVQIDASSVAGASELVPQQPPGAYSHPDDDIPF